VEGYGLGLARQIARQGEILHNAREPLPVLEQIKRQLGADTFNAQYFQASLPDKRAQRQIS